MLRRISHSVYHPKQRRFPHVPNRPLTTNHPTFSSFPPNPACPNTPQSNVDLNHALQEMSEQGLNMKFKDYDALLNQCVNQKSLRGGQRVQAHMIKTRYLPPVYLRTRLIVFYVKCEVLSDARMVFDEMPVRNVVSWTALISGYARNGFHSEALNLFVQMLRSGTDPNEFTFSTVLTSCTGAINFDYGKQVHSRLAKSPFHSHVYVGSSLLDFYAKAGNIHEARTVFNCVQERDVVSCAAIISGYAQLGLDEEALLLFQTLLGEGMAPNYITCASILSALAGLAALEYGKQVHGFVLRLEFTSYIAVQNSLIDMYSKCGNLTYARRVFDVMPEKSVVSWNVMLMGYSKHGIGEAVVELYTMMKEENKVGPDGTTFLTVLSGCSHGGMEDKGLEFFDEMATRAELGVEHYGCVVDLLGRAGRVERALRFIQEMPFEPNAVMWSSLLGACLAHRNVGIGKIAGEQIIEMEPENSGNYVILCNLYASNGRWDEVRKLRGLMKEKGMVKEPGKSWIELDRTLHTFYASDQSHPRKEEVFSKVRELSKKVKLIGYNPDLNSVLCDVDEEQRENMLLGHSEKLALAFGMINISEGKAIRVMKNLRICVDCHNFAKFVSQVYRREILIRDKSRFHCIVNGICSCGDYW